MSSINHLRGIIDANCLTGSKFIDWLRNLKILLKSEHIAYVLEGDGPVEPASDVSKDEVWEYHKWQEDSTIFQCHMLASMCNEFQRQHEDMEPKAMLLHLIELFAEQSRTQRYEISKSLFRARMAESSSVQAHVLKMIEWIKRLVVLGVELPVEMSTNRILQSLPESFSQIIFYSNMNKIHASLLELLNMLTTAEGNLQKEKPQVLFVGGTNKKRKVAFASKRGKGKKQVKATLTRKDDDDKGMCFHCGVKGHWRRNCKRYLNEKAQRKHDDTPGIYMIDTYLSYRDSTSWVLDTGCTSHICNDSQGLKSKQKLRKGEVELRMGNDARVAVVALGVVNLKLPSGDYLSLEECHYVPSIVKNITLVSCLDKMGYTLIIKNKCCSIYLGSKLVVTAPLVNDLYLIDVSSYNLQMDVAPKKSKQGVNEAYL